MAWLWVQSGGNSTHKQHETQSNSVWSRYKCYYCEIAWTIIIICWIVEILYKTFQLHNCCAIPLSMLLFVCFVQWYATRVIFIESINRHCYKTTYLISTPLHIVHTHSTNQLATTVFILAHAWAGVVVIHACVCVSVTTLPPVPFSLRFNNSTDTKYTRLHTTLTSRLRMALAL